MFDVLYRKNFSSKFDLFWARLFSLHNYKKSVVVQNKSTLLLKTIL
jgi:hypothetical protein